MMKKADIVYLKHIRDAISRIEEYTKAVGYDDFIKNNLIQDGVIYSCSPIASGSFLIFYPEDLRDSSAS